MSKFNLARWLQALVRTKPNTIQNRKPRTRLLMEQLEDRVTPTTLIWDGGGASNVWDNPLNWNDNLSIPRNGDDLVFPSSAARLANVNNMDGLALNSISFSGSNYSITGNAITLVGNGAANSGFIIANFGSINNTIGLEEIVLGGAAGNRQFFTVGTAGASLTISAVLSGSTGVELSKDGPGTLILTADNSGFTGAISIVEGALNIRNALALGTSSSPTTVLSTVQKTGQLQVENVTGPINEPLVISGPGPTNDGALLNVSGNNTWAGTVTLDGNATIGSNIGSLIIAGVISDLGGGRDLTKEGAGTVVFDPINAAGTPDDSTGNSYRGRTFVNSGILAIRHSYALGNITNTPTASYGSNDTVVNSFTNRSGTLQIDFVANPNRRDPNVNAGNDGFTIPNELLTLNGPGFEGIHVLPKRPIGGANSGATVSGALNSFRGSNTWVRDISLWSDDSSVLGDSVFWSFGGNTLPTVGIGAEAGSTLIIAGHIGDSNLTPTPTIDQGPPLTITPALAALQYSLIKTRPGRVVFVEDNYYRGKTEILQGYLNIRDSLALGAATLGNINNGTFVFPGGTLELEADELPDSVPGVSPPHGLIHLNTDLVITNEQIRALGNGFSNDGAIRNIRGVNEITGNNQIQTQLPRNGVTFNDYGMSIGVLPDYNMPNTLLFDRSQLTISGIIADDPRQGGTSTNLTKFGMGELVLTGNNTYTGRTFITEGWITARHDNALGGVNNNNILDNNLNRLQIPNFRDMPDNKTPETYIAPGAMLVLKQTRTLLPQDINLAERIFVSGNGIDHLAEPGLYPAIGGQLANLELNRNGAILNLSGNNKISGVVTLVATASTSMVGIGADLDSTDVSVTQSSLTFTNLIRDDIDFGVTLPTATQAPSYPSVGNQTNVAGQYPYTIATQPAPAGINKLGRKRISLQGQSTFTGDNQVSFGVLRLQSDTALGMVSGTTTVNDGAAVEFAGYATDEVAVPLALDQYASSVIAFSSQFSTTNWSAAQALGAPNTSVYNDIPTAWSALSPDGPPDPEFLTLGYTTPVFAGGVTIRESWNNGFVTQVELLDINDVFHTVFGPGGVDPSPQSLFDFAITFPITPYLVKGVRVTVNPQHVLGDWEEIDAVQLSGITGTVPVLANVNNFNGGLPGGIQVRETFILNGMGNLTADDPSHFLDTPTRVATLTSVSDDNQLRAPITFQSDVAIDSRTDSRFTLWKSIDGPGGFTKEGAGKLVLGGDNFYRGETIVNQGIVNLQSGSALGGPNVSETQRVTVSGNSGTFTLTFNGQTTAPLAFNASALAVQTALNGLSSIGPNGSVSVSLNTGVYTITFGGNLADTNQSTLVAGNFTGTTTAAVAILQNGGGGTTVANDGQIELQGDITIGGETLTIQGNGPNVAPNVPLRWYANGPGPIEDTFWTGNSTTGRVTGVSVDPNDSNVLYLSAAGGGAWRSKNNGFTWQPLIDNIDGTFVDQALFTGAIAVAPANSNFIYVGLGEANNSGDSYYGRGILKSADFGRTWTYIQPPGSAFDKHTISKIVVDPVEPETIYVALYGAGVNEGIGGFSNPGNYGIWRQRNGGAWVNLTAVTMPVPPIPFSTTFDTYSDLLVFNSNPRITNDGTDLVHPDRPNDRIIVFSIGSPGGSVNNAVYISVDAHLTVDNPTWTANGMATTEGGFPSRNGNIKIAGVRNINARDSISLFAAVTYPVDNARLQQGTAGTLRAGDGIQTAAITYSTSTLLWSVSSGWGPMGTQPPAGTQGFFVGQGWYDSVIAVQSQSVNIPWTNRITLPPSQTTQLGNPNFLFIAGVGSVFSPGPFVWNGSAWSDVDPGTDGKGPHVDYHASTFDRTGRLIVGNDGGIYRMENLTAPGAGAAQWTNLNQSNQAFPSFLQITTFNSVDVHPFDPFYAIGGSQDNGTQIYQDNDIWTSTDVGGDGGLIQINNKNPNIAFMTTNGVVYRSLQGGAPGSWNAVYTTRAGRLYFPLVIDRTNPSRVLVGDLDANGNPAILESLQDGAPGTFFVIGSGTSTPNGISGFGGSTFGNQIAVSNRQGPWVADPDFPLVVDQGSDSYDSDTVYAITTPRGVHVTKNHGQAWVRRNGTGGNTLPTSDGTYFEYSQIKVDPRNRDIAYVVRSVFNGAPGEHVFRTTDAGQNWIDISGNLPDLPTWSVEVNSQNGDIYVGTDNGVYYLPGGSGTTWTRFGVGLPNALVSGIVFNPLTNMLTVSTYGRGMWQVWLDDSQPNSGAIRAVSGSSVWTGAVRLSGDVDLRAEVNSQVNFVGTIADVATGDNRTINKVGPGRLVFSGSNTYGGVTEIREGALVVRNTGALGSAAVPSGNTIVRAGAALELQSDLVGETVQLNGNGIAFNGHNTGALRNVSGDNTFTGTLVLESNSTIGVDSGSTLTIGTKAGLAGTGHIDDGAFTRGLVKELTGTLVLNSANTYDGLTDIVDGVLRAENPGALGGVSNGTQVRNGAQFQISNNITIANENLSLSGTGISGTGALLNFSGNNTWQGAVILTAIQGLPAPPPPIPPSVINIGVRQAADSLTINGTISEGIVPIVSPPFGLTKVLPGKLILTGSSANTYSGVTTIQEGVINIQKAQALGTPGAGPNNGTIVAPNPIFTAALETEGNFVFAAETVILNGVGIAPANRGALRNISGNNTWTGPVILNSTVPAIAEVQRITLAGTAGTFTLTFNGQTTTPLPYNATATEVETALNNLSSIGGTEIQTFTVLGTAGTYQLTFNGQTTTALAFDATALDVETALNALTTVGGVGGNVTVSLVSGVYTVTFGGTLAGFNQPVMTRTLAGVTDVVINTARDGGLGRVNVTLSGTVYTITFAGALTGINQTQITGVGSGGATVFFNTQVNGSAGANPIINIGSDAGQLTITGVVQDPAAVPASLLAVELHKVGPGAISFNEAGVTANTYQGRTVIEEGILNIHHATSLGASGVVSNDTTVRSGGTLQLEGGFAIASEVLTINGLGQNQQGALANNGGVNSWNGTIVLGSDASVGANTVTPATDRLIINGQITDGAGTFSITKLGIGTVEYAGGIANDYQGVTQVNLGTLVLNKSGGALPFGGVLNVGDDVVNIPAAVVDSAILRIATSDQIPNATLTTVNADGLLDLNTMTETINRLVINNGHVATGATGVLTIGDGVAVSSLTMTGGDIQVGTTGNQLVFAANATISATSSATETAVLRGSGGFIALAGAATRTFNVADGPRASDLQVTAPISRTAAERLIKTGAGLMEIDSLFNTQTGVTEAAQGVLQVDGIIGDVQLNGGTLSGNGTTGTVLSLVAGGTEAPGDATGILNTGTTVWNAATLFFVDLNGDGNVLTNGVAGTDYDQLRVTGNINLGGATINGTVGFGAVIGEKFTVIQTLGGGTVTGRFAEPFGANIAFIAGKKFVVDYSDNTKVVLTRAKADVTIDVRETNNNNTTVWGQPLSFTVVATPEPGAAGAIPPTATVKITLTTTNPAGVFTSTQTLNTVAGTGASFTFDPRLLFGITLDVGTHTVKAEFQDPTNAFNDIDDPLPASPFTPTDTHTQTVIKASTNMSISSSSPTAVFGAPVAITAVITIDFPGGQLSGTSIIGGTVTFTLDGVPQTPVNVSFNGANWVATYNPNLPTILPVDTYLIRATYNGDVHFNGFAIATDLVQTITQASSAVSVTDTPDPSDPGQNVSFVVLVSSVSPSLGTPTGTVVIRNGLAEFNRGTVTGSGTFTLTFNGQTTAPLQFNAAAASIESALNALSSIGGVGGTASVSQTGNVYTVTFGGALANSDQPPLTAVGANGGAALVATQRNGSSAPALSEVQTITVAGSGRITFDIATLPFGLHNINVEYQGDSNFIASTGSTTHTVKGGTTTTVVGTPSTAFVGQNVAFVVNVGAQAPAVGPVVGNVELISSLDGSLGTQALAGGSVTFNITSLTAGSHIITANYLGDALYAASTGTTTVNETINKANTATAISSTPTPITTATVFGQTVTFTATVTSSGIPTGTVEFRDGATVLGSAPLVSGVATFPTTSLSAGAHANITAVYLGNANYNTSTSNATSRTVTKAGSNTALNTSANPAVYGQAQITATVTAVAPGGGVPEGSVTFTVTNLGTLVQTPIVVNLVNGVATLTPPLNVGSYSITAQYTGSINHDASAAANPIPQTITQASTGTNVSSTNVNGVYGEPTITAAVTPVFPGGGIPTGQVTFHVNNGTTIDDITVTLNSAGVATLPTVLNVGNYTITANYLGSTNFTASPSNSLAQTIFKANTSVAIGSSANPSIVGQTVTFTVTISTLPNGSGIPAGTVDFIIDSVFVAFGVPVDGTGKAVFQTSALNVSGSPHTIAANFNGGINFNNSNGVLSGGQTVNRGTTTLSVTPSSNPALVNSTVNYTVTVSPTGLATGTPTGTVELREGATLLDSRALVNGSVVLSSAFTTLGNHNLTINYLGSSNFDPNSSTLTQSIASASTTAVATSGSPSVFGTNVTFTATVSSAGFGIPTGTVSFVIDGVNLSGPVGLNGAGQASFQINSLNVVNSPHSVEVVYSGSSSFLTSTGTLAGGQTVTQNTTTTVLQSTVNPSVFGQSTNLIATVAGSGGSTLPPTGSVTFFDITANASLGSVNLDTNGRATLPIDSLSVGNHNISATFAATSNFAGSSDSRTQVVNKANTTTTVTASQNPSFISQNVTFTATVVGQLGGVGTPGSTVNFIIDGVPVATNVALDANGKATFSIASLTVGFHTVQVQYNGTGNFNASTGNLAPNQEVRANPVSFGTVPGSVKTGTPFTIIVKSTVNGPVTLALNNGPAGGTVSGNLTVNAVNGTATFSGLRLNKAGVYRFRASINGLPAVLSGNVNGTANRLTVAINPAKVAIGQRFSVVTAALDATNAVATNYNGSFRLVIVSRPVGSAISGKTTGNFKNGRGTLANLSANKAGKYVFRIIGPNGLVVTTGTIEVKGRRSS